VPFLDLQFFALEVELVLVLLVEVEVGLQTVSWLAVVELLLLLLLLVEEVVVGSRGIVWLVLLVLPAEEVEEVGSLRLVAG
jgi:hypothetical protein